MPQFIDRTGQRFGRLIVLRRAPNKGSRVAFWVRCDCGAEKSVLAANLIQGTTISCGCHLQEQRQKKGRNATHGRSKTRIYEIWCGMRKRCENPNSRSFKNYGGRGISVCDRWQSFENFLADMGEPESHESIDRIDVNGDYEPSNCRWADDKTQSLNRRCVRHFKIDDRVMNIPEAAEYWRVPYATAYRRLVVAANRPEPI